MGPLTWCAEWAPNARLAASGPRYDAPLVWRPAKQDDRRRLPVISLGVPLQTARP
jgi:hypothetical protein